MVDLHIAPLLHYGNEFKSQKCLLKANNITRPNKDIGQLNDVFKLSQDGYYIQFSFYASYETYKDNNYTHRIMTSKTLIMNNKKHLFYILRSQELGREFFLL